jgi:hypothetical protein
MALADYVADIARDDTLLRSLVRPPTRRPLWFRHPYLETGPTQADREGIAAWLDQHGYRVAPVTVETSDDAFALPYDDALIRGDRPRAKAIRAAYLAYSARSVDWYRRAALDLFGRRPALVFLLHASRLNADCVDELSSLLRRRGLRPVSLAAALSDPVYGLPDGPPDANGDSWLDRWAVVLRKPLAWNDFPEPPADIVAADRLLDDDP